MGNEFLKNLAYENLGISLVKYIKKNPENNIIKLTNLLNKFAAITPGDNYLINKLEATRTTIANDPNLKAHFVRVFKETSDSYLKGFFINLFVRATIAGLPKRQNKAETLGVNVPYTILIDPTEVCNLHCQGCWAGKHDVTVMPFELFDRILHEAKELGMHFIVLSGGEPTTYPYLFDIAAKHRDMAFMMYTNGTLINEKMVKQLLKTGNISPVISLEGWEKETDERRGSGVFQKIISAMSLLKESGVPFGYSVTATSRNYGEVCSDAFVQFMIKSGALYGWSFHYIPVGRQPDYSAMVTPEQRKWLVKRAQEIRSTYPLMFYDFWNDGELVNGCIAGGKRYFHITANGNVAPCAFAHIKCDSIKDKSLEEVLANKVFRAYQKYQPVSENHLRPCPIIDKPEILRAIVKESDAMPSYEGATAILQGEGADFLDNLSAQWEKAADEIMAERLSTTAKP